MDAGVLVVAGHASWAGVDQEFRPNCDGVHKVGISWGRPFKPAK